MIEISATNTVADLTEICPKAYYGTLPVWREEIYYRVMNGASFSVRWNDELVCMMGHHLVWPGVYSLWAITSDDMSKCGVSVTLAVRRFIETKARENRAHRLQMFVKADFAQARRWAHVLGFEAESLLRHYGSDQSDYILFRRFF